MWDSKPTCVKSEQFDYYETTSEGWSDDPDDSCPTNPKPRPPPGEGWELMAFSATPTRLFWTWKKRSTYPP